ncbi:MAG: hemolysin III family protein [Actinomycetota bacterium]
MDPVASAQLQPDIRPLLKGWSHVVAAVAAVAICPILIALAPEGTRAPAAIYSACVIALFAISATYHRFEWSGLAHAVIQRLDHSMIFVVIAATYTPIAVVALPDFQGRLILAVVWTGAIGGAVLHLFWPDAPRKILVGLYLTVGWVALVVIVDIWRELGVAGFVLLLAGGLMHSVGGAVYALKRPDPWPRIFGFHEVFHLFVIAGIACHYIVVAFFAIR